MFINHLAIKNFRNYVEADIHFVEGLNLLIGNNGSGKTNLLEAIHYISYGKPIRIAKEADLVRFSANDFFLETGFNRQDLDHQIRIYYSPDQKRYQYDGVELSKKSALIGQLVVVPFSPEDADVIRGGAAQRRRAMDIILCSSNQQYLKNLKWYNKTLKQRNALLQDFHQGYHQEKELKQWDKILVDYGDYLMECRRKFTQDIKQEILQIVGELNFPYKHLDLIYDPSVQPSLFSKTLESNFEKDISYGWTTSGPHRDDLKFILNHKPVAKFASRGQQRLISLLFRLAEVELYFKQVYEYPVIIIDEAFIELDNQSVDLIVDKLLSYPQIILASADPEVINHRKVNRKFKIGQGSVEKIKI
ncbi:MAG: hypothetical protein APR63_02560 [Desulfuromonas sp. SDB]|nr:MAG: hypothetical protein APR63_02560 [Desulfuromonas sp. SDB]